MKPKKLTTTKIVLFIPYIITLIFVGLIIYALINKMAYTYISPLELAFVASLGVCGYVTKWYLKKAALENEPKIRLGIIQEMLTLQRMNPDLKIYDVVQMKQDANNIISPIKNDEQKHYETLVVDDVTSKITS